MEAFKNEFYASTVIKDKLDLIEAVEINGMIYCDQPNSDIRRPVCIDNGEEVPDFFSAYVRFKDGSASCVADTGTHAECLAWARQLVDRYEVYNWTLTDVFASAHH